MMQGRTLADYDDGIVVGPCHYCDDDVVMRFAGQLGSHEVWVRRHASVGVASHDAITSAEVWDREDGDDDAN